ncbi:DNA polymerase III subunit alpha [Chromobacterium violaceum]|uniref:DNA polymerase III subunit alpha n=1 Tax=Chromobacterium violaceum TaxID=536 RepID=A0A3S4HFR3_CHRVL|nr:DNA polymerase III subunit alpha [Chromobacterium violaceum]
MAGFVTGIRVKVGNRGKMAFVQLDDGTAKLEVSLFAESFELNRDKLKEDVVLVVEGKVSEDSFSGGLRIVVDKLYSLGEARSRYAAAWRCSCRPSPTSPASSPSCIRSRARTPAAWCGWPTTTARPRAN